MSEIGKKYSVKWHWVW